MEEGSLRKSDATNPHIGRQQADDPHRSEGQGILNEPSAQPHIRGVLNALKRFGNFSGTPAPTSPPTHYTKFV